jgi:hypothetical protein
VVQDNEVGLASLDKRCARVLQVGVFHIFKHDGLL